jgi:hypothetical protein
MRERGIRDTASRDEQRPPLTVRRSPTGYVLHDPLLVRLAGIEAVPLPFTAQARPAVVLEHLRRLNPSREVCLETALSPIPARDSAHIPHPSP